MPSEAVAIIEDARAPMLERSEALAVVQKAHMPGAGDVVNMDKRMVGSLLGAIEQLQAGWRNPEDEYAKAATQWRTGVAGQPITRILKKEGPQSLMFADKMGIFGMAPGRWSDKPSPIGFEALRLMVNQTPILNGIVMERIRQIQRFMRRAEQDNQPGFELRHRIKEHAITKDERKETDALTRFFLNCGWEFHPYDRKKLARDTFAGFVSKIVRDTLTMDAMPIELERTRDRRGIHGFYAIDGATIRLCGEQGYEGDDEIKYVQVVQGIPVTTYTLEEMLYEIRNPRTNVEIMGYGYGETEMLVRCVTGFLNAMTLNLRGFDQNYIPKGLLTIFGNYNEEQLIYFKQQWNAMVAGVNNAWTLPVLASPNRQAGATYTPFNVQFNEMYFSKWMTFLVSIICAIYGMGPDEINFESFSARSGGIGTGNDTGEKLAASKEKGLEPVLNFLETIFTGYFLLEFTDKYVFRVTGLHPRDEARDAEYKKLALTVDEVRAELGYEKMEKVMKVGKNDPNDKDTEPEVVDEIAKALGAVAAGDDPGSQGPPKAAERMAGGSRGMPGGAPGGPPGASHPGGDPMGDAMGPGASGAEEDSPSAGELVGNAPINPSLIPLYQQAVMPQPQGPMGPEGMDFGQEPEGQDGQAPPEEESNDFGREGQVAKAILPVAFR